MPGTQHRGPSVIIIVIATCLASAIMITTAAWWTTRPRGEPQAQPFADATIGFAINHTHDMAALLRGIREINDNRPPTERIRMVGMDVQRIAAAKRLALSALRRVDPAAADKINSELSESGAPREARDAATALHRNLRLQRAANYLATRAEIMAHNLQRTVAEETARGNNHTLLFAHDGHDALIMVDNGTPVTPLPPR